MSIRLNSGTRQYYRQNLYGIHAEVDIFSTVIFASRYHIILIMTFNITFLMSRTTKKMTFDSFATRTNKNAVFVALVIND